MSFSYTGHLGIRSSILCMSIYIYIYIYICWFEDTPNTTPVGGRLVVLLRRW